MLRKTKYRILIIFIIIGICIIYWYRVYQSNSPPSKYDLLQVIKKEIIFEDNDRLDAFIMITKMHSCKIPPEYIDLDVSSRWNVTYKFGDLDDLSHGTTDNIVLKYINDSNWHIDPYSDECIPDTKVISDFLMD